MIVEEMIPTGIRHYSDSGMMLRQVETGILYSEANDIYPCPYTYEETNEPIPELLYDASDSDIARAVREVINDE